MSERPARPRQTTIAPPTPTYDDSGCDYWDSGWADETEYVADDGDEVGEEPSDGPLDVLSPCAAQEFTSIFINIPL